MKAYIITGAPGAGKTELIEELSSRGYTTFEEVPRKLLKNKIAEKLGISPFQNLKEFADLVFEEMYKQYIEASQNKKGICFFDRGIPDVFAYLENSKLPIPIEYYKKLNECHFERKVFICPPWKDIYISDSIRPYSYEDTVKLHSQIIELYERLKFTLINVPKLPLEQRATVYSISNQRIMFLQKRFYFSVFILLNDKLINGKYFIHPFSILFINPNCIPRKEELALLKSPS